MPLLLLVAAFVAVPLVELWVILQVGDAIGVLATIGLLLGVSVVGTWLVRREGAGTWRRFREALASGRVPAEEVVDGALVIVGGALLLTPGFVTDVVGLACVAPPTRAVLRRWLQRRAQGSLRWLTPFGGVGRVAAQREEVVDVEVVDITRDGRPR